MKREFLKRELVMRFRENGNPFGRLLILCAFLVLTVCACGGDVSVQETTVQWESSGYQIQGYAAYPMQPGSLQAAADRAYYISVTDEETFLICVSAQELSVQPVYGSAYLRSFCINPEGNGLALYEQKPDGSGLVSFADMSGEAKRQLTVSEELTGGQIPQLMCLNTAGDLALLFEEELVLWNGEGECVRRIPVGEYEIYGMEAGENGSFLAESFSAEKNSGWLLEFSATSDSPKRVEKREEKSDVLDGYPFSWSEIGLVKEDVTGIAETSGKYYVWTCSLLTGAGAPLYLYTVEAVSEDAQSARAEGEKTQIAVVTQGEDSSLDAMAVAFNRENTDVCVTVEHLGFEENAWNLRLASKEGMDLVLAGAEFGMLQRAGYLEPLDAFLDSLEQDIEGIVPAFLAYWQADGETYGIPRDVSVSVPYVRISGGSGISSCTTEQLLELFRTHPEIKSPNGLYAMEILRLCLYGDMEAYLTEEAGGVRFETEKLKNLCLSIGELQTDAQSYYEAWEDLLGSQEAVYGEAVVGSVRSLAELFEQGGENLELLGYPTEDGNFTAVVSSRSLCLTKQRRHTEEALEFMRFFYANYDEYYPQESWAVDSESLREQIEEAAKEHKLPDGSSLRMSEAQQEATVQLLEGVKSKNADFDTVFQMISEELWPYFTGDKDPESAIGALDSRVTIYLEE